MPGIAESPTVLYLTVSMVPEEERLTVKVFPKADTLKEEVTPLEEPAAETKGVIIKAFRMRIKLKSPVNNFLFFIFLPSFFYGKISVFFITLSVSDSR